MRAQKVSFEGENTICAEDLVNRAVTSDSIQLGCENKIPSNVRQHRDICIYLNNLYARKNKDYGDRFHLTFVEDGLAMARIRLGGQVQQI